MYSTRKRSQYATMREMRGMKSEERCDGAMVRMCEYVRARGEHDRETERPVCLINASKGLQGLRVSWRGGLR